MPSAAATLAKCAQACDEQRPFRFAEPRTIPVLKPREPSRACRGCNACIPRRSPRLRPSVFSRFEVRAKRLLFSDVITRSEIRAVPAAHQAQAVALERFAQRSGRARISVAEFGSRITRCAHFPQDRVERHVAGEFVKSSLLQMMGLAPTRHPRSWIGVVWFEVLIARRTRTLTEPRHCRLRACRATSGPRTNGARRARHLRPSRCHCEERSDEAIHLKFELDCRSRQSSFAMTRSLLGFSPRLGRAGALALSSCDHAYSSVVEPLLLQRPDRTPGARLCTPGTLEVAETGTSHHA